MKADVKTFMARAEEIAAEGPGYERGHSGDDHLCDCIGLVIGALRRCGVRWSGIHGSNYAARSEMEGLQAITGSVDLVPGELVYKVYSPGNKNYRLPERYQKGGSAYTGDVLDYYHVGVVISTYPLRIRHMTTPQPRMDTSIGKWAYHGWLKKVSREEVKPVDTATVYGGKTEFPVNMRAAASTNANLMGTIHQGATVEVLEGGDAWNRVRYNGVTGYVKSEYVHVNGAEQDGEITVNRAELERVYADLEKAYDIIGDMLGKRG